MGKGCRGRGTCAAGKGGRVRERGRGPGILARVLGRVSLGHVVPQHGLADGQQTAPGAKLNLWRVAVPPLPNRKGRVMDHEYLNSGIEEAKRSAETLIHEPIEAVPSSNLTEPFPC